MVERKMRIQAVVVSLERRYLKKLIRKLMHSFHVLKRDAKGKVAI